MLTFMTNLYRKQGFFLAIVFLLLTPSVFAQTGTVVGTITDTEGLPLPGARAYSSLLG